MAQRSRFPIGSNRVRSLGNTCRRRGTRSAAVHDPLRGSRLCIAAVDVFIRSPHQRNGIDYRTVRLSALAVLAFKTITNLDR